MSDLKLIIPAAGAGTRLRPHTHTTPKTLVEVAGKPILGHVLDSLLPLEIEEVIIIIGYMGDKIRDFISTSYDLNVKFIEQPQRMGLGYAISLAKEAAGETPVLITLDDTIIECDLRGLISSETSAIGVKGVDDPTRFGVVELSNGYIKHLVEKPSDPPSNLAIVGIYYIKNSSLLFACLDEIIEKDIKVKDEYQLTSALELMIEKGEKIAAFPISGWFDCGRPETLLATNRYLLEKQLGQVDIPGSIIIPPVAISKDARIERSIIGPYVSVARGCVITDSIIRDSIINENARLKGLVLENSLIGTNAVVQGHRARFNVGDSSEVIRG